MKTVKILIPLSKVPYGSRVSYPNKPRVVYTKLPTSGRTFRMGGMDLPISPEGPTVLVGAPYDSTEGCVCIPYQSPTSEDVEVLWEMEPEELIEYLKNA